MNKRESDFAARHGYTMNDVIDMVESLLVNHKCPVWSISQITDKLFKEDSRSLHYRHVQKAVYTLEAEGKLSVDNWFDCNNVTVVYAVCRFNPPPEPEFPF